MARRTGKATAALLLLMSVSAMPLAQELSPRAYWPAPQGTQIGALGFAHTRGDTIPDPSLPIAGLNSSITTAQLSVRQTFALAGRTATFVVDAPYASGRSSADVDGLGTVSRDYDGLGDIAATLSVNFVGAPAMDRKAFAEMLRSPRPLLGGSVRIVAPTGRYDPERLLNVGANRWATKLELGYILPLGNQWIWELEAGGWWFQDNDDFLGLRREQAALYSVETHLVRQIHPGLWVSLDANFYRGGRSTLGGRRLDNLQRDSKAGFTLVFPFNRRNAFKLAYEQGSLNDSDENFRAYSLSYLRTF